MTGVRQPPDGEPRTTIYVLGEWRAAVSRIATAPAEYRPLLDALLDHVEAGWAHVRELQRWYDSNAERARESDDYAQLLNFVDAEAVDAFRALAGRVALLVPAWPVRRMRTDPEEIAACSETFARDLTLLRLAASAADIPAPLSVQVERVARGLSGWGDGLGELARIVDERVIQPPLPGPRLRRRLLPRRAPARVPTSTPVRA